MKDRPEIRRREGLDAEEWSYEASDEKMCRDADDGRPFGFKSLGIHHIRLIPGRCTSLPHAK